MVQTLDPRPLSSLGNQYIQLAKNIINDNIIQAQALELQVFTQNIWASRSGASLGVGDIFPPKVIVEQTMSIVER